MQRRPTWQCPLCKCDYDTGEIESMLMDVVSRKSMSYVLQDVQCKKCLQVGSFAFLFSFHAALCSFDTGNFKVDRYRFIVLECVDEDAPSIECSS